MSTVILVIHLMIAAALVFVVLLQKSEGGALGIGGGGGGGLLTGRGTANFLSRATAALAAAFFITSLALTILAQRASGPRSVFDTPAATSVPATGTDGKPADGTPATPGRGGVLDRLQGPPQATTPAAPAPAPAAPAAPAGPVVPQTR
jgi:preprotein translocase subunit SecG